MRRFTECQPCQERFNPFGQRLLGIRLELLGQSKEMPGFMMVYGLSRIQGNHGTERFDLEHLGIGECLEIAAPVRIRGRRVVIESLYKQAVA